MNSLIEENLSHDHQEGSDLRRMQYRMQEILEVFDSICNTHEIPYWLSSGTLLGARRHGGFIPWDDDLDVQILQEDYSRLMQILEKELPPWIKIQNHKTDKKYKYHWTKLRDIRSKIHEPSTTQFGYRYDGIFFDIFPMEPFLNFFLKKSVDDVRFLIEHRKFVESKAKRLLAIVLYPFYPLTLIYPMLVRFIFRFIKKKRYTYCAGIASFTEIQRFEDIFPLGKITFEGKEYNAPHDVDTFLANNFGPDFMQLPPPELRQTHIKQVWFLKDNKDTGDYA